MFGPGIVGARLIAPARSQARPTPRRYTDLCRQLLSGRAFACPPEPALQGRGAVQRTAACRSLAGRPLTAWLALALVLLTVAWALWPVRLVQVEDAQGLPLARLLLADDAPLQLSYVHSIYRQPAVEEFAVRADGLELVRLASPSVAVLEYYARPEPIVPDGEAHVIRPAPERYAALAVRVGAVGQRTLRYAGQILSLHGLAADGERVTLQVVQTPRLALLWPTR